MLACKKRLKRKYIILCSKKSNITRYLHFLLIPSDSCEVSKFDFTGTTTTEKVSITISDKDQMIEYLTPNRDNKYQILDYDYQHDKNNLMTILSAVSLRNGESRSCRMEVYWGASVPFCFSALLEEKGAWNHREVRHGILPNPRWRRDRENRPRRKLPETKD